MTLLDHPTKDVERRLFSRRAEELEEEISELEDEAGLLRVEVLEKSKRSESLQRELELVLCRLEELSP